MKVAGITILVLFATFFVYANLDKPTAGEKIYMSDPTGLALVKVEEGTAIQTVADVVSNIQGATSHTYQPENGTLVITYSKNETDRESVVSSLIKNGINAVAATISSNKPQCPVHGYLDAFYAAKYALNIRK